MLPGAKHVMRAQWHELDPAELPSITEQWRIVNFFAAVPKHLQGSVLLALTRKRALLIELSTGIQILLLKLKSAAVEILCNTKVYYLCGQSMRHSDSYLLAFAAQSQAATLLVEHIEDAPSTSWRHQSRRDQAIKASGITDYQWQVPPGAMRLRHCSSKRSARLKPWFALDITLGPEHHASITPEPIYRSWDWAWRGCFGPAYLWVYVARTSKQIIEWLKSFEVYGFRQVDEEGVSWQCVLPSDDLAQMPKGRTMIVVFDGGLKFYRGSYHAGTNCFDGIYLRKLAAGDLGELSFDLFDGDYVALNAAGNSCASLSAYLKSRIYRTRHFASHRWNDFKTLAITVPLSADIEESVRAQLNQAVGAPADQDLRVTLFHTPIALLPRYVSLQLPCDVSPPERGSELAKLIGSGFFSRICWQWSNLPKPNNFANPTECPRA